MKISYNVSTLLHLSAERENKLIPLVPLKCISGKYVTWRSKLFPTTVN
jgi:hypothetical protein